VCCDLRGAEWALYAWNPSVAATPAQRRGLRQCGTQHDSAVGGVRQGMYLSRRPVESRLKVFGT